MIEENKKYWAWRAPTYSKVNKEELSTNQHTVWQDFIKNEIEKHFPDKKPEAIKVIDVGTGPGFFAIILKELGYSVTAVDMTRAMIEEAKCNAKDWKKTISFMEMDAEDLQFDECTFDVVVSRNLTWNLPNPENAYKEWIRVLKKGGLLLNFDANWYKHLFDEKAHEEYEKDRKITAERGLNDFNIGENYNAMDRIARRVPLSRIERPAWDVSVLGKYNAKAYADKDVWKILWSEQEKVNFNSTPMFMVRGIKNE